MSIEVTASPASDVKSEVNKSNITAEQFAQLRVSQHTAKAKAPAPQAEEKPEPKQEPVSEAEPKAETKEPAESDFKEGAPQEPEKKSESKEVLSKSVDELTDEEIQELAQKGKSGLLKRIAELTAKRKLAEEKAAQFEAALRNSQPVLKDEVKDNPYAKIETAEEIQSKWTEVGEVVEWAEGVLDKAEHAAGDEIVATVDGKELTKAQVKELRRSAVRAKEKFLPAQLKAIQEKQAREQAKAQYREQARKELDWMNGEDNDVRKQFENLLSSPVLKKVRAAVPEAEVDLEYVLAHAANSIWGRKSIPLTESKPSPRLSPPAAPSVSAGASERKESTSSKQVKEAAQRFASGKGAVSDYVALRAAQISQRKSIKA